MQNRGAGILVKWAVVLGTILAAHVGAPVVVAQDAIVTDRPDFTESSSTVGRGVFQLEGGATYLELTGGTDVTTLGEVLIRWGIAESLELRFLLPTYEWDSDLSGSSSGFLSSGIGLKLDLAAGSGSGFFGGMEAAVIVATTVPTGTAEFASSHWQPQAVLATSWELGTGIGLGVNFGVGRPADDQERYTTFWASVALGVEVAKATSVFFEIYGFNREEDRGPNTATFQAGVVYLFNPDFQFDIRAARRLTDRGVDVLIGAGLSWRLGG